MEGSPSLLLFLSKVGSSQPVWCLPLENTRGRKASTDGKLCHLQSCWHHGQREKAISQEMIARWKQIPDCSLEQKYKNPSDIKNNATLCHKLSDSYLCIFRSLLYIWLSKLCIWSSKLSVRNHCQTWHARNRSESRGIVWREKFRWIGGHLHIKCQSIMQPSAWFSRCEKLFRWRNVCKNIWNSSLSP